MRGDGAVPKGARDVPEDRIAADENRREGKPPRDAIDQRLDNTEPFPDDPDEGHQRDDGDEAATVIPRRRMASRMASGGRRSAS